MLWTDVIVYNKTIYIIFRDIFDDEPTKLPKTVKERVAK